MYRGSPLMSTSVGKVWWASNFPSALSFCADHERCYRASAAAKTTRSTCFPVGGLEPGWRAYSTPKGNGNLGREALQAPTPRHNIPKLCFFFFFFEILLLASTKNTGVIFHMKKKNHDNWNAFFFFFFTSYKGQHLDFQLSHTQYHAGYQSTCCKDKWGEPGTPRSLTSKIINGVSGQRALWKHANKASRDQDKIGRTLPGLHKAHCLGTTVILESVTAAFGSQHLEGGKHLRNTADSCLATAVTKRFSK